MCWFAWRDTPGGRGAAFYTSNVAFYFVRLSGFDRSAGDDDRCTHIANLSDHGLLIGTQLLLEHTQSGLARQGFNPPQLSVPQLVAAKAVGASKLVTSGSVIAPSPSLAANSRRDIAGLRCLGASAPSSKRAFPS
jgi:hypothetical protein